MFNSVAKISLAKSRYMAIVHRIFDFSMLVFLIFNLVIRFSTILNYPPYNGLYSGFFRFCCLLLYIGGFISKVPKGISFFIRVFVFSFWIWVY